MALDPGITAQIQYELDTLTLVLSGDLTVEVRTRTDAVVAGGALGSGRAVTMIDGAFANSYKAAASEGLRLVEGLMSELRVPWVDWSREPVEALLRTWLDGYLGIVTPQRPAFVAVDSGVARPWDVSVVHARQFVDRLIKQTFDRWVLRQTRRTLPLSDLLSAPRYASVRENWEVSLSDLDAPAPRFQTAASNAVHAVEAVAKLASDSPTKSFGQCISVLRNRADAAGSELLGCFEKAWSFANNAPYVRHAGVVDDPITETEARAIVGIAEQGIRVLLTYDIARSHKSSRKVAGPESPTTA